MTGSPSLTAQPLLDDDSCSTHGSGTTLLAESFTFEDVLFREHARINPLDPVTRIIDPRFPFGRRASPETSDSEEPDAKRIKIAAPTPVADACTAATELMRVLTHAPILADLRYMRMEIGWLLEQLIAIMEMLQLESRFLEIFLPDDAAYSAFSAREALELERITNPDSLFRRSFYHHNAILHDAECNFLQASAILFRERRNWAMAYSLEELLHTQFNEDFAISRLLCGGHLLNIADLATADPKTLASRLAELEEDYPIFRFTTVSSEAEES
jgi:hypothetical protein